MDGKLKNVKLGMGKWEIGFLELKRLKELSKRFIEI